MSLHHRFSSVHRTLRRAEMRTSLVGAFVGMHLGPILSPGITEQWRLYFLFSFLCGLVLLWWTHRAQRRAHEVYRVLIFAVLDRLKRQ